MSTMLDGEGGSIQAARLYLDSVAETWEEVFSSTSIGKGVSPGACDISSRMIEMARQHAESPVVADRIAFVPLASREHRGRRSPRVTGSLARWIRWTPGLEVRRFFGVGPIASFWSLNVQGRSDGSLNLN